MTASSEFIILIFLHHMMRIKFYDANNKNDKFTRCNYIKLTTKIFFRLFITDN
jgi:hypothetical protein